MNKRERAHPVVAARAHTHIAAKKYTPNKSIEFMNETYANKKKKILNSMLL